jgi:Xaa-Pro aminopeptidase
MIEDELRQELASRRQKLRAALGDDVLVLFSAPEHLRNGDVSHAYRQDSDFFYLTGFDEPEAALVLRRQEPGFVLFVRPRDPDKEIWDGRRAGEAGAMERFGADAAHPIGKLQELLPDYFEDVPRVHYFFGRIAAWDKTIFEAIQAVSARRRKKVTAPTQLVSATELVHAARRIKSPFEVSRMQRAAEVTVLAHRRALVGCRPGLSEHDLAAELEHEFRRGGAKREAYESIVASGENATILHYRENDRTMLDGELVLIDAGTEVDYYAADLTSTFPVGTSFSPAQRHLYQLVLDAHRAALAVCKAGSTIELVHRAAFEVIRDGLATLGWISGSGEELDRAAGRYFMHRTSHYLGMDVHDVGPYHAAGSALPLEPGVAITVEPGVYVARLDETVPEEFRGIGIRIEDDVVITHGEPLVLTGALPREVDEIEALRRVARSA